MFRAQHASVGGLAWNPVGPGPDPGVLIESSLSVNGTRFRVLGFRVPMPFSAGWTGNGAWEDDKGFHCDGLLWDVGAFRDYVRAADAAAEAAGEPPHEAEAAMDPAMEALSFAWLRLAMALGCHAQDWRPAIVRGCPYILVGHPAPGDAQGCPAVSLEAAQARSWFGQPEGVHSFNLLVEGGVCALECAEVRALGAVGGIGSARPMGEGPAAWLSAAAALLGEVPGASAVASPTLRIGGRSMAALLRPMDADLWSFDANSFVAAASDGLARGRMRWFLDIPLDPIDDAAAGAIEGIAGLVRARRVSRLGRDACVALRLGDVPGELGIERPPTPEMLRSAILKRLYRVSLRGYGRRADDVPVLFEGGMATRLYAFNDALYLSVSPAFARLADVAADGAMRALPGFPVFETALDEGVAEAPAWVETLPAVADGRIRAFIAELSGGG